MKKLKIALLTLLAAVILLPSCKKGKDDPFISLKSRDSRITAKWKLTSITGTESDITISSGSTTNQSKSVTYNGSTEISTTTTTITGFPTQTNTTTSIYSYDMTIDKLGVVTYNLTAPPDSYTGNGTWVWASNNKNKDVINISLNGTGGFLFSGSYDIDQLKSKELVFKNTTDEYSASSGQNETKHTEYTYTFEKQ